MIIDRALANAGLEGSALFLGAMGALFMARAGIVDTSITAHFILVSIVFGYVGGQNVLFGVATALALGMLLAAMAFWANQFNRRTYILFLYTCSLVSIPLGNLVLNLFPSNSGYSLVSPRVEWQISLTNSVVVALIACVASMVIAHFLSNTPQGVLLKHWSQSSPAVVGDLKIAGVLSWKRIRWAATPTILAVSFCYFGAVVFGCFAQERAYLSGKFDFLPFWMLLIGLAAKDRAYLILLLVLLFVVAERGLRLINEAGTSAPTQSTYIVYGVLFLLFSIIGAKRRAPRISH